MKHRPHAGHTNPHRAGTSTGTDWARIYSDLDDMGRDGDAPSFLGRSWGIIVELARSALTLLSRRAKTCHAEPTRVTMLSRGERTGLLELGLTTHITSVEIVARFTAEGFAATKPVSLKDAGTTSSGPSRMSTTMPVRRDEENDKGRQMQAFLNDLIGRQVIRSLGSPTGLFDVQVKQLWDDHYRVNVRVGPNITSVRIANSFFLTANDKGAILSSSPTITKVY